MKDNKLKELLDLHQLYHSKLQQDYFITSKAGGTKYGCLKQALRELYKRFRGLRETTCDQEKLKVEIDKQKYLMENSEDEFERRFAEIEYRRKIMQMEESERVLKETKREFTRFYEQASYLKEQLGKLTPEKIEKLDAEMWEHRIKEMAAIDYVSTGRLRNNTFELLHSLPKNMKLKLLEQVKNGAELVEWYENKKEYHIPEKLPKISYKKAMLELGLDKDNTKKPKKSKKSTKK